MGKSDKVCREIGKVFGGIFLLVGALVLLGWNEKRTVYMARTINKAHDEMIQLDTCVPDPKNNGKLVAIMGCEVTPTGNLQYSTMLEGISSGPVSSGSFDQVFAWSRTAEQYVFHEKSSTQSSKTKKGKKTTTTTYSYEAAWVTSEETWSNVNAAFDCKEDLKMTCTLASWPPAEAMSAGATSSKVCCGSSTCSSGANNGSFVFDERNGEWSASVMRSFGNQQALRLPHDFWDNSSRTSFGSNDAINCGEDLRTTDCGDITPTVGNLPSASNPYGTVKWTFDVRLKSDTTPAISGLALQYVDTFGQTTFQEWVNPDYDDCDSCKIGVFFNEDMTGEEILDDIESSNKTVTWILRFLGWCLLWGAYFLCVSPVAKVPELIPTFGKCMKGVIGVLLCGVTCLAATTVTLLVISIAWLAYRPVIGVPLLLVVLLFSCGISAFLYQRRKKQQMQHMQHGQVPLGGSDFQQHYDEAAGYGQPTGMDMQAYPPPGGAQYSSYGQPADPGGYGGLPAAPGPDYGIQSPGYAPPPGPQYGAPPVMGGYPTGQPEV
eukprot:TRINITY_DN1112_c4_g1_i1.p1 TRINITY_DN1112_c4_g1~~TRINITY_DN1112_c4_g1_i1.p1  ORF type:complete len:567 (+),score=86.61 TRINITY_DN1112_c4_g1_i1:62-1702(+)